MIFRQFGVGSSSYYATQEAHWTILQRKTLGLLQDQDPLLSWMKENAKDVLARGSKTTRLVLKASWNLLRITFGPTMKPAVPG